MFTPVPRLKSAALVMAILAQPLVAAAETITYGPMLSRGPTPDTMIVRWGTQGSSDPGLVSWRKKGDATFASVSGTAARDHEVVLTGLAPGSEFEYSIKSGSATSATYSFNSCPAAGLPMDVVFYGDSRSGPSAHARVVAEVQKHSPEIVFESGDLVPSGTYAQYLSELFPVIKDMVATTPFMAAPGNHDNYSTLATNYGAIFPSPRPTGQAWQPYYSFVCGNAMFIALNSNDIVGTAQLNFLTAQLRAAAADTNVTHVLVWFHHSAYSPGSHGDNLDVQNKWVPLFNDPKNKVTAVFSGHDHLYARLKDASSVLYIVSGGAGADLYSDTGRTRATKVVSKSAYNFVSLHIAGNTLSGTAFDDTGTQIDTFSVTKSDTPVTPPDMGTAPPADGGAGSDGGGNVEEPPPPPPQMEMMGSGCSLGGLSGSSGGIGAGFAGVALGLSLLRRRRRRG